MSPATLHIVSTCAFGLEEFLAAELRELGARRRPSSAGVTVDELQVFDLY